MGLLFRVALRLAPLRKLKARRTQLLLEKSFLLEDTRRVLRDPQSTVTGLAVQAEHAQRLNAQLDAINNEIGRRGGR